MFQGYENQLSSFLRQKQHDIAVNKVNDFFTLMIGLDPLFNNDDVLKIMVHTCEQNEINDNTYTWIIKLLQVPQCLHVNVECIGLYLLIELSKSKLTLRNLIQQLKSQKDQMDQIQLRAFFGNHKLIPSKLEQNLSHPVMLKYFAYYMMFIQFHSPVLSVILEQLQTLELATLKTLQKLYLKLENQFEYLYTCIELYSLHQLQILVESRPYQLSKHGNFIYEPFECIFAGNSDNVVLAAQNSTQVIKLTKLETELFAHLQIVILERFRQSQSKQLQLQAVLTYFAENNSVVELRDVAAVFLQEVFSGPQTLELQVLIDKHMKYLLIMCEQLLQNMQTFSTGIGFLRLFQNAMLAPKMSQDVVVEKKKPTCIVLVFEENECNVFEDQKMSLFHTNVVLKFEAIISLENLHYELFPIIINADFAKNLSMCLKMFDLEETIFFVHGFISSYSVFIKTCLELKTDLKKLKLLWEFKKKHHPIYQSFFKLKELQFPIINRTQTNVDFTDKYFKNVHERFQEEKDFVQIPFFAILNQLLIFSKTVYQNLYQIKFQRKDGEVLQYPMVYACRCNQQCRFTALINAGDNEKLQIYGDKEKINRFLINIRGKYLALTITSENMDDIEWVTDSLNLQFRGEVTIICDDVEFRQIVQISITSSTQIQCIDTENLF